MTERRRPISAALPRPPRRRRDELGDAPPPAEGLAAGSPGDGGVADAAVEPDGAADLAGLAEKLRLLPDDAGVYLFRDARRRVIYVGKAKRLRSRVRSYFRGPLPDDPRLRGLRRRIRHLDWVVTSTEVEALVLEDSLIKQYAPHYNIRLKDDKRYPYLKVTTGHRFPALVVTRQVTRDGARYFGPFTRVKDLRRVLRTLRAVFRLRNCSDRRLARGGRECLQYFIHRCSAPCTERVGVEAYAGQVRPLVDLLSGRGDEVVGVLEAKMRAQAEALRFEESARLRDEVAMLRELMQEQGLVPPAAAEADVVGLAARGNLACGVFLHVREGRVLGKSHRLLTGIRGSAPDVQLRSLLLASFLHAARVPRHLLLPVAPAEEGEVAAALAAAAGHAVELEVVRRGPGRHLLEVAARNAHLLLEEEELRAADKRARVDHAVYAVQEALGLAAPPYRIEGFDISNLQASHPVASMVSFRDGLPWKGGYRRFRMRETDGPDDFAMMAEVLRRRLRRLRERPDDAPDLILVDGGAGQVASARAALVEAGFDRLPLIGLAKRHEEIVLPDREETLRLPRTSDALRLLQRVRDEAHRFAVGYHRHLRSSAQRQSRLDAIPGVGPKRRRLLLREFGSVAGVRDAGVEAVAALPGIGPRLAEAIVTHLAPAAGGSGRPQAAPGTAPAPPEEPVDA